MLELWFLFARLDVLFVLRGPKTAVGWYVSDLVIGLAAITASFLLAERFDGIPPWSRDQMGFFLGYALLVRGSIDTFFNYNIAHVSRRIGRGQLDHVLVQPQPLWMVLLTEGFAPLTGAGMLLPGVLTIAWSIGRLGVPVSASWLGLFVLYLGSSITIVLAFSYAWGSLAFWAPRAAEEVNSSTWRLIMQLNVFPLDGLPAIALASLVSVVPVGLVAWYPASALLGLVDGPFVLLSVPLVAIVFAALSALLFARGLHHYGQVGSSRYLAYGHRR